MHVVWTVDRRGRTSEPEIRVQHGRSLARLFLARVGRRNLSSRACRADQVGLAPARSVALIFVQSRAF